MAIFSNDLLSDGHKDQVKAAWHNHFMLIVFIFSSAIEHAALLRLLNSNIFGKEGIEYYAAAARMQ